MNNALKLVEKIDDPRQTDLEDFTGKSAAGGADVLVLDPSAIDVGERLRDVDGDYVTLLAASIREQGQIAPVQVRRTEAGGYALIAGAHRLFACQQAGLPVRATVVACSVLEARLLEIDENLIRRELNPLDRAVFLAERKAVYEELYPETKNGGKRDGAGRKGAKESERHDVVLNSSGEKSDPHHADLITDGDEKNKNRTMRILLNGNENNVLSFCSDTARKLDFSPRTIERAVRIARNIPAALREELVGTRLAASQKELLALADIDLPEKQQAVVRMVLAGAAASIVQAVEKIEGRHKELTEADKEFNALGTWWARASRQVRLTFLATLKETGELDRLLAELAEPRKGKGG